MSERLQHDREPLPTREMIEAIADVEALEGLRDELEARIARIEVDLDYRPGDEEWAGRARGALAAHNICFGHVSRRLHRLSKLAPVVEAKAAKSATKTARHLAAEARALAEAEARKTKAEADKLAARERMAAAMERTSWLAMFHKAAARMLDAETFGRLSDVAAKDYTGKVRNEVGNAA